MSSGRRRAVLETFAYGDLPDVTAAQRLKALELLQVLDDRTPPPEDPVNKPGLCRQASVDPTRGDRPRQAQPSRRDPGRERLPQSLDRTRDRAPHSREVA